MQNRNPTPMHEARIDIIARRVELLLETEDIHLSTDDFNALHALIERIVERV